MQRPADVLRRKPIVIAGFCLYILWGFGWETAGKRLLTEVNGTIIACVDRPATGAPRYASLYTLRAPDGHEFQYVAGCTDASLPRSLPVGASILKRKWEWTPVINGNKPSDYTAIPYFVMCTAALAGFLWMGLKAIRQ